MRDSGCSPLLPVILSRAISAQPRTVCAQAWLRSGRPEGEWCSMASVGDEVA